MSVTRTPYKPPPDGPVECVYVDSHLLVVDKPCGLLSVPGRGPEKWDCLEARVRKVYPEALTVHRLDMETSGLVLFARSPDIQRALSRQFERRQISKCYTACVAGRLSETDGIVDAPLMADWPNRPLQKICADGKPAKTRWIVTNRAAKITRLKLVPVTGRTHQLRLHMASIGHPILGDTLYGHQRAKAMSHRLALHATSLCFEHPADNHRVEVYSSPPF